MSSDKKSEKKAKKNKKKTNYIIIFDGPKAGQYTTDWDKKKYGPVEKGLSKFGEVEPFVPAPKATVRLWPTKPKAIKSKQVKKAVKNALEANGSAFIIERPSGEVWTWPSLKKAAAGKQPVTKWSKQR